MSVLLQLQDMYIIMCVCRQQDAVLVTDCCDKSSSLVCIYETVGVNVCHISGSACGLVHITLLTLQVRYTSFG